MTTQRDIERVLDRWFEDGPAAIAPRVVDEALGTVAQTAQSRRPWPVAPAGRRMTFLGLAGLAAAVAIAVAIGSGMIGQPSPGLVGAPSLFASPSAAASESPSGVTVVPSGPIAYIGVVGPDDDQRSQVWVVDGDGSDVHPLMPGIVECQFGPAWSPDGTRIVFSVRAQVTGAGHRRFCLIEPYGGRLWTADSDGSSPEPLATGCVDPCTWESEGVISNDGTRLAFVRHWGEVDDQVSAIAVMELATGRVSVLEATRGRDADDDPVTGDLGGVRRPRWSPDDAALAYWRFTVEGDGSAMFVIDTDGRDRRMLSPRGMWPEWSPDGSRIVFTDRHTRDERTLMDVATVRPDGTDMRILTADHWSSLASWTADGSGFARYPIRGGPEAADGPHEWRVMAADGTDAGVIDVPPQLNDPFRAGWVAWPPGS